MKLIFEFLCGLLYLIGYPFGLTYEEISIYICIYLWPSLCTISTIPIILISFKKILNKKIVGIPCLISSIIYFLYYCYYTNLVICRYNISNPNSFTNCMLDLKILAKYYEISYETLNILIYVIGFILIITFNIVVYKLIKKYL